LDIINLVFVENWEPICMSLQVSVAVQLVLLYTPLWLGRRIEEHHASPYVPFVEGINIRGILK